MTPTVLAFGSHPDDIELGCGGTLAQFIERGATVVHACLTSGEAGSQKTPPEEMARLREAEAREAAKRLGSKEVHFLGFPDGAVSAERSWKVDIINLVRAVRPQIVFTHSKSDHFPDHRLFSQLVLDGVRGASGPWYPECVGSPHRVEQIYGYEVWHPIPDPQLLNDISEHWERKLHALQAFESQMSSIDYVGAFDGLARYRGALSGVGPRAEAFDVIAESTWFSRVMY